MLSQSTEELEGMYQLPGKYGPILRDQLEEAFRIQKAADENGIPLRIIGCLAFRIKCPEYVELHKKMGREVTDIDFITYLKYQKKVKNLFRDDLGYRYVFPSFQRATTFRDLFINEATNDKIDVFYDELKFNHIIDFKKNKRLDADNVTIPLAELFLEKTQIIEINAKDLKDLIILFLTYDVSESDDDSQVNGAYIANLLSDDWGLYYTVTANIQKFIDFIPSIDLLTQEQKDLIISRVEKLGQMIEDAPKSRGWRRRAKVGTKKLWYHRVHIMEGTRE